MPASPYNFATCPDRRASASMKWERYRDRDVLPFSEVPIQLYIRPRRKVEKGDRAE